MKRSFRGLLTLLLLLLASMSWTLSAAAQEAETCNAAGSSRQMASEGRFREARALLSECVNAQCDGDARRRCALALKQLGGPSIVVRAEDAEGNDVVDVTVKFDGDTLATSLSGLAIPVDPGEHTLSFERPGYQTVQRPIEIKQSDKFRSLEVRLTTPVGGDTGATGDSSSSGGLSNSRLVAGVSLAAVGVGGLVGFTWLGLDARSMERALEQQDCKPRCSRGAVDSVRKRYLLTNISVGVGVLALAGATWLLLGGDSDPLATTEAGFSLDASPSGGFASYTRNF